MSVTLLASLIATVPAVLHIGEAVLTALTLAVALLFVLRYVRQPFLLSWVAGGTAFFTEHLCINAAAGSATPQYWLSLGHVCALLATALIAYSILMLTAGRSLEWHLAIFSLTGLFFLLMQDLFSPQSRWFFYGLCLSVLSIAFLTTYAVLRHSRGRREHSPWVMLLVLIVLQSANMSSVSHYLSDAPAGLLFGIVSCLIVGEEAAFRTLRLEAIRQLSAAVAEARDTATLTAKTLRILRDDTSAMAAWFRRVNGDTLQLKQRIALPESYAELFTTMPYGHRGHEDGYQRLDLKRHPTAEAQSLYNLGCRGVLALPVRGHNSELGYLYLAYAKNRRFTSHEMRFLNSLVSHFGAAIENLNMVARVIESQNQWASTFDSIGEMILVHDSRQRVLRCNRAMLQRLGKERRNWPLGRSCAEILPNHQPECPYCQRAHEGVTEAPDPCFGGLTSVATSTYNEEGSQQEGTVHVITDVTREREAERRYRQLFEEVQEGVFIATPEGRLLDCNQAFANIFGYSSKKEMASVDMASLYHTSALRSVYLRQMHTQGYVRNFELMTRRRDGETIALTENSFAIRNAQGGIERLQGLLLDITDRKRAEVELSRRNRELQAVNEIVSCLARSLDLDEILTPVLREILDLFDASTSAVYLINPENNSLSLRLRVDDSGTHGHEQIAPAIGDNLWRQLLDTRPELLTRELTEALQLPPLPPTEASMAILLWSQKAPLGVMRISRPSPQEFTAGDATLYVSITRQIAGSIERIRLYEQTARAYQDLREMQQQLLQSEKMSALGKMISGVTHELNNPLTAILGYSQLIDAEPLSPQGHEFAAKLLRQVRRTQSIVLNLLRFSRQSQPSKQMLNLCCVLDDTLSLRDYDLTRHGIQVERNYEQDLPPVLGDANQLEQVFLNIINNAADSMLEKGQPSRLAIGVSQQDGHIWVEIHDSGEGIQDPSRIFDPFYTTKPIGKGTGLGLSICYGIIKQHQGDIVAFNHPEGGAVFQVRIPIAIAEEQHTTLAEPQPVAVLNGSILLQADDSGSLNYTRDLLSGAGARVTTVRHIEQAIACIQRQDFDAVLFCGHLPGAYTLEEIHRLIARCRPGQQDCILICLPPGESSEDAAFAARNHIPVIDMPVTIQDMFSALRLVLESSAEESTTTES